ncbi:MAG TPA: RNB domain-containing ribonuclease [Pyrinomonadaceae bacterium]|nr:RNB domain-containing ribonuclease [Pyrinomonadaceae bacterium]
MNDNRPNENWLDGKARQAMIDNGFEPEFSREAFDQLREIEGRDLIAEADDAKDLRDLDWSSIDNKTSRDLDQVEWAEQLDNGDIRVLVGIADVDAAVEKGSPIDKRAARNTVSVYTESEVFPMLPEELSTDRTSLNENEDRLAVVADMIVKENGDVPQSTFYRAIVRNRAKLDYPTVGEWFDDDGPIPGEIKDDPKLIAQLELQRTAAERLHKYRQAKGALEFESIESEAVVEDGDVKEIRAVRTNSAKRLIENFMVASNVEMAEFLESHGVASIRRIVHTPRNWDGIVRIAAEYGDHLPSQPDQPALAAFLEKRRNADPERFPDLSLSIIKLIGSGLYVVERPGQDAGGHFGLGVRDYAHSTAPNRRYPDIAVQRLVKSVLRNEAAAYTPEELDAIAEHCNDRERAARKVERKMRKIVAAAVMKKRIGERFGAIVTGVTDAGTFARILRPPVDGRIVRGEHGLSVGEKIDVKLLSANTSNGFIDFEARH